MKKEKSVPVLFSYAKILYAVGQVFDQIGAKGIHIHEQEDGLLVEVLTDDNLQPVQVHYTVADLAENLQEGHISISNAITNLYDIVRKTDNLKEEFAATPPTPSLLRQFLATHRDSPQLLMMPGTAELGAIGQWW